MHKLITITALWLVGAMLWGCDTEGLYDVSVNPGKAVTLSGGVAIHETALRRIVYLEATPEQANISQLYKYKSGERLEWLRPGPLVSNPTDLFVMTVPIDKRDTSLKETLIRINSETKKVERYATGSSFDTLTFDPLGKYAILLHGSGSSSDGGFYNPNEAALIDLSKAPGSDNPTLFTVQMGSRRINGVTFLPEITVSGASTNMAVFLADGAVKIVDLSSPSEIGTLVPLVAKDDPRTVTPKKVMVRNEDQTRDAMVFVLANGSQDIYGISLTKTPGSDVLRATLNQFEAGGNPTDMVVAEDGDTPLLVVISPSNYNGTTKVNVVKIDTSETFSMQLEDTVQSAFLHQTSTSPEIVFYGNSSHGVHFLTVDNLASEKGRNLDDILLPDYVQTAMLLDTSRLLLVSGQSADFVILDLTTRKSTRFTSPKEMNWGNSEAFSDRLYFLSEGADQVDVVDLRTDHPMSLLLDDRASSLHLIKDTGAGVVLHNTPTGRATIFNLSTPAREKALVIDGIWLDGFLDETEAQ